MRGIQYPQDTEQFAEAAGFTGSSAFADDDKAGGRIS
jgi:hypothetical protein